MSEETHAPAEPAAIFVALPPLRSPMIQLPRDVAFGETAPDTPHPPVKFSNGRYEAHNPRVAEALRKHPACRDNNVPGDKAFFELPRSARQHGNNLSGFTAAILPAEGLTNEDRKTLESLRKKLEQVQMPPPGRKKAIEEYDILTRRFSVSGLKPPRTDDPWSVVLVRIKDLLELLEESGIDERR